MNGDRDRKLETKPASTTLRAFAASVLLGGSLDAKLRSPPARLTDDDPVGADVPMAPARDPGIAIETETKKKRKVPPLVGMPDPAQRVRIVHALMNHELQAIELFAWAVLRYPGAPRAFRHGLVRVLGEEQTHFRLYANCLERLGARFGDWPLSAYFWSKASELTTPARFVACMCLTFENANLDHALDLSAAAAGTGEAELAAVLQRVHDDELGHVRFGWRWLERFKRSDQTMTDAYHEHVVWPLRPALARGATFHRESRERIGLDEEFVALLEEARRPRALYKFDKPGREE